jgi:hypothetical protein
MIKLPLALSSLTIVLAMPSPCSVIALEIVTDVVQVNVPAGRVMVSPFEAAFCKACTLAADPSES